MGQTKFHQLKCNASCLWDRIWPRHSLFLLFHNAKAFISRSHDQLCQMLSWCWQKPHTHIYFGQLHFDTINKIYNDIRDFYSVKNFINLLWINFYSILSILGRREMGLQLGNPFYGWDNFCNLQLFRKYYSGKILKDVRKYDL